MSITSLLEKLNKGGPGSGIKGRHTAAIKEYKAAVYNSDIGGFTTISKSLTKSDSPYYVAVVPINMFEEVLLGLRKEDGIWTTPAGGANLGEQPEDCAVRECFEEAGLIVDKDRLELIGIKTAPNGKPVHCYLYRTEQDHTHVGHDPDEEVNEWVWTNPQDLPRAMKRKKNQNRLETVNEAYMMYHGLKKSNYGPKGSSQYVEADNTRRKKNNTGEQVSFGANNNRKQYTTSGSALSQAVSDANAKRIKHENKQGNALTEGDKKKIASEMGLEVSPTSGHGRGPDKHKRKMRKSMEKSMENLLGKLQKGGPGSGRIGHKTDKETPRDRLNRRLAAKNIPKEKWHLYSDKKYRRETSIGTDALGNDLRPGEENRRAWAGQTMTRDYLAQEKRREELEIKKGGPGSGQTGHKTAQVISLKDKLKAKNGDPKEKIVTKLDEHLKKLASGAVLENAQTESGKSIFSNMEHSTAHGYTVDDHNDAMNHYFSLAQKMTDKIDQLESAGHKLPESAHKIKDFHNKKFKEHFRTGQKLADRQAKTEEAKKVKKGSTVTMDKEELIDEHKNLVNVLESPSHKDDKREAKKQKSELKEYTKKSTTQMGYHGSPDLNTGEFATSYTNTKDTGNWLEQLYGLMDGYDYGDAPRELMLDKGTLSLVKVDDGQYTGYFRYRENGMEDNAKIRIERINLPELVQLLMAKEYITPMLNELENRADEAHQELSESRGSDEYGRKYIDTMDAFGDVLEAQELTAELEHASVDRKLEMLRLISKLLN